MVRAKSILIGTGVQYTKGETVFESVRLPSDYSQERNYATGSRLIYDKRVPELNLSLQFLTDKHLLSVNGSSSFGYRQSGDFVDDDFYTDRGATRRKWGAYDPFGFFGKVPPTDSPYRYSDQHSTFIISRGNNEVQTNKVSVGHRFYFAQASPDPWKENSGMFLVTSFHYEYTKYKTSDSIYYVPYYYTGGFLPYSNITFSNDLIQAGLGLGYVYSFRNWVVEGYLQIKRGEIHSLDFHVLRNLRLLQSYKSYGYFHHFSFGYKLNSSWLLRFDLDQDRTYAIGTLKAEYGGSPNSAIAAKLMGTRQSINLGIKDTIIGISILKKIEL